jgi:hypothetical protein
MTTARLPALLAGGLALLALAAPASAHITPPVVLVSDRDAVASLLAGARRFFVREVRLSPAERDAIQHRWGFRPDEDFHRFYLGRDEQGRLVASALFVTEFTIHGPVRVAVGIAPDGTVRAARIVEVAEETYPWIKPLIDGEMTADFVGRGARATFGLPERVSRAPGFSAMSRFYGQIIATLVHRAVALHEAAGPGAHAGPR